MTEAIGEKEDTSSKKDAAADFDTAIRATGFGKFNVLLILAYIPFMLSQLVESNSMIFAMPIAQCDLDLTLENKGQLFAASYVGMIVSGACWGYASDRFGRRTIMIYGFLLHWFNMLMTAVSQNYLMIMIFQFLGGIVINGPFAAFSTLLSEYHSSEYRAQMQLVRGILSSVGHILLPLLAWIILPRKMDVTIFGIIDFHAWNLFLFICSLAPLFSFLLSIIISESPKYLMSTGRNEEALKILRKIYKLNTGKPIETYPIHQLVDEKNTSTSEKEQVDSVKKPGKLAQFFHPPYLKFLLLSCVNSFLVLTSTNTLRLWMPQLLQAATDYEHINNGTTTTMCHMLEVLSPKKETSEKCTVNLDNDSVYFGSIIIKFCTLVSFIIATFSVNKVGKRSALVIMAIAAGASTLAIYLVTNSIELIAVLALAVSCSSVSLNVSSTITLELFPTMMRTTALSLFWVTARIGTVSGNLLFPMLLEQGCLAPFIFIAISIFCTAGLAGLFPNTENVALK